MAEATEEKQVEQSEQLKGVKSSLSDIVQQLLISNTAEGSTKEAARLEALAEGAPEEGVVTTTARIADLVASVEETPLIPAREEAVDVLSPEEWLKTEAAFELIRETFTLGDKGNNIPRGQAAKFTKTKQFFDWIKTYFPQGKDAYDPKFYTESDLGQFELKLKQDVAKRRIAKEKKIWDEYKKANNK